MSTAARTPSYQGACVQNTGRAPEQDHVQYVPRWSSALTSAQVTGFPPEVCKPSAHDGRDRSRLRRAALSNVTHSNMTTRHEGLGRGPVRGPARGIIPAQRVPSARFPVSSVQLARSVHAAGLLVNGRPAVRIRSPAPRSARVLASPAPSPWNECPLPGLSCSATRC